MRLEYIKLGMRVEAGERGTEHHDAGRVSKVEPCGCVTVDWDSGVSTRNDAKHLRVEGK